MFSKKKFRKKNGRRRAGEEKGGDTIYYIYIYMICGLRLSTITSYLSTIICCGGSASGAARGKREVPRAKRAEWW